MPGATPAPFGLDIRLSDCTLWIPQKKVMAFKELAAQLLHSRYWASGGLLARVVGKLGSFRVGCIGAVVLGVRVNVLLGPATVETVWRGWI
jgi:hypothetical protein